MDLKNFALNKCNGDEERQRLLVEFGEIDKQGLWGYFEDLIKSCKKYHNENNLFCAFLWGICPENPMAVGGELVYLQSNEMPDIDVDVTPKIRNKIKEYCAKKYGEDRVISIVNYNTFGIKSGIKNIAKTKNIPLDIVNECTMKIDKDIDELPWDEALNSYPALKKFKDISPDTNEVCQLIEKFSQRVKAISKHAGGLCIANQDLTKTIPLLTTKNDESEKRFVLSSFAEGQGRSDLKNFGLVKLDFLGLSNLDYIDDCLKLIDKRYCFVKVRGMDRRLPIRSSIKNINVIRDGHEIVLPSILSLADGDVFLGRLVEEGPRRLRDIGIFKITDDDENWSDETYLNDKLSLKEANDGNLDMVFQFDAQLVQKICRDAGVDCFKDLVTISALNRPGPLDAGMAREYIERKNGRKSFELHPLLSPILQETFGIIVYQEQLMKIANVVGLISLPDCELLRKAMAKKQEDKFGKFKAQFVDNGQRILNWSRKEVEDLWAQMITFANYGFNKSHSLSYSVISARCLYLKAHFPIEYCAAVLSNIKTGDEKMMRYIVSGRQSGIEFLPANINKSQVGFTIFNDKILFGFNKIKGINKDTQALIDLQPFSSFDDYLNRFGHKKTTTETLIKIGAFDSLESNRKKLLKYFEYRKNKLNSNNGLNRNRFSKMYKNLTSAKSCPKDMHEKFKNIFLGEDKSLSFDDATKNIEKFEFTGIDIYEISRYLNDNREDIFGRVNSLDDFSDVEDFNDLEKADFEKEYYSVYFSHPLAHTRRSGFTISDAKAGKVCELGRKTCLRVEAIINDIKTKMTKNSNPYYVLTLEDETDNINLILWENEYNIFRDNIYIGNMIMAEVKMPAGRFPTWNLAKNGEIKKIKTKYEISDEEEFELKSETDFRQSLKHIGGI